MRQRFEKLAQRLVCGLAGPELRDFMEQSCSELGIKPGLGLPSTASLPVFNTLAGCRPRSQ
jgi:hypothetical protein